MLATVSIHNRTNDRKSVCVCVKEKHTGDHDELGASLDRGGDNGLDLSGGKSENQGRKSELHDCICGCMYVDEVGEECAFVKKNWQKKKKCGLLLLLGVGNEKESMEKKKRREKKRRKVREMRNTKRCLSHVFLSAVLWVSLQTLRTVLVLQTVQRVCLFSSPPAQRGSQTVR